MSDNVSRYVRLETPEEGKIVRMSEYMLDRKSDRMPEGMSNRMYMSARELSIESQNICQVESRH